MNASSASTSSITCLPREILVKILTGLPAKSAVRFRCSCKFFYSYIPEPRFAFSIIVVLPSSARFRSVLSLNSLSYNEESHGRLQADSAQDLDVRGLEWPDCSSAADGKMVLLNRELHGGEALFDLSTGRRISLPPDHIWSYCTSIFTIEVVGFDSVSERYKVFRTALHVRYREVLNRHWVLTVGVDESWRELESTSGYTYVAILRINGIIYFIPDITWPRYINELLSLKIFAMDVATESFIRFIPFPSGYHPSPPSKEREMGWVPWIKLNGRLSFINFIIPPPAALAQSKIEIWTWERSMEEWEMQTALLPLEESEVIRQATSMGFATNSMGEIVFLLQSKTMSPLILVYSFGRGVWKKFEISGVSNYKLHQPNMKGIVYVHDEIAYFLE